MMTRRETLLKIAGLAGGPVFLAGCNMDAVRRAGFSQVAFNVKPMEAAPSAPAPAK